MKARGTMTEPLGWRVGAFCAQIVSPDFDGNPLRTFRFTIIALVTLAIALILNWKMNMIYGVLLWDIFFFPLLVVAAIHNTRVRRRSKFIEKLDWYHERS